MIFAFLKKKAPGFGALTFPLAIFLSFYANISTEAVLERTA
jgi:hypothetical protein